MKSNRRSRAVRRCAPGALAILTASAAGALVILTACAPMGARGGAGLDEGALARAATIVRDEWGVPHIYGPDEASVAFGAAFAQAEDAYWQIEEDYIHALGRAAHYYGERSLARDALIAGMDVERLARDEYAREPADRRAVWDAFSMGLNYYLRVSEVTPRLITVWEPWMLFARYRSHVLERALAHVQYDSTGLRISAGLPINAGLGIEQDTAGARNASRAWAVAPARSASGQTLMVQAVDASFVGRDQMYEMHLHSASGWHVRGFALLGTPLPVAGHNEHAAWLVVHDQALTLEADAGASADVVDTVQVNTHAGVEPRALRLRRSGADAVVTGADGRAYVLRIEDGSAGGMLQQLHALSRVTSLAALTTAVERNPAGTSITYADAAGNIQHVQRNSMVQPQGGSFDTFSGSTIDDDSLTLERLVTIASRTHVGDAAERVGPLVTEWEEVGGSNPDRAMRLDDAIQLLRTWDGNAAPESPAATLYVLWQEQLRHSVYAGSYALLRALEDVVAGLRTDWRTVAVPWGEMQRLQRLPANAAMAFNDELPSLPARGAPAWTGAAMIVETVPATQGRRRYAERGTIMQAVELGARPRSLSIMAFGQSADPASPVHMDQAPLYSRGELKPAWFTREDVTTHARRTYRPAESVTVPRVR